MLRCQNPSHQTAVSCENPPCHRPLCAARIHCVRTLCPARIHRITDHWVLQESTVSQTPLHYRLLCAVRIHRVADLWVLQESFASQTAGCCKNPLHYRLLCASNIWILRLKPAKARSVSRPHQNQNSGSVEDPVSRMKRGAMDGEKHLQSTHQTKGCDLEYRRYSDSAPQN